MSVSKPISTNDATSFANASFWSLAKREVQDTFSKPRFWIGFAVVVLMLTVSGPFDTQNLLNMPARFGYWTFVSVTTFVIGISISQPLAVKLVAKGGNVWAMQMLSGLIAGIPITVWVWLVNSYGFGFDMGGWPQLARLAAYCMIITAGVVVLYSIIADATDTTPRTVPSATPRLDTSPFFDRLQKPIGTDIISLQSRDHYLEVITSAGSDLILHRLRDAERELAAIGGLRVHRSWWVAQTHAKQLVRENERTFVELSDGRQVPVGRSYLKKVRAILG
ncbi:LytTR family DNA-binding domain-containing protein [Pseudahrensia aquimaris]|uniref:LytTR family DNA-binding domain-containing protein n=1 Tax=Pseudahrensia aquimaris TaxID=744461 RepID=A0ABW3FHR2_9HYPH